MIKRGLLSLIMALAVLLGMQNCKHEKPDDGNNGEPDSLFVGTPYIIQKPFHFPNINNPYKDSLTVEGIELGRRLFYDKHLSSTGQLSCASCHKQEFAFSDAPLAKSTNVFGPTRRNSPPIQNLLWSGKLFWDGRVNTLADQAKDAGHGELDMNIPNAIAYLSADTTYSRLFKKAFGRPGDVTEQKIYNALQQFMMTLISSESKFDSAQRGLLQLSATELRGFQVFQTETGDCFHCHTDGFSLTMTDNLFRNNGLDSATSIGQFIDGGRGEITGITEDYGRFRDPSMRNVALTAPYMHDGRFATLQQVVDFYSEGNKQSPTIDPIMLKPSHANGGVHLNANDKQALIDYLNTLTDHKFITNPAFSNPF